MDVHCRIFDDGIAVDTAHCFLDDDVVVDDIDISAVDGYRGGNFLGAIPRKASSFPEKEREKNEKRKEKRG